MFQDAFSQPSPRSYECGVMARPLLHDEANVSALADKSTPAARRGRRATDPGQEAARAAEPPKRGRPARVAPAPVPRWDGAQRGVPTDHTVSRRRVTGTGGGHPPPPWSTRCRSTEPQPQTPPP